MKWIKTIWYFLTAFIGMCIVGFFGLIGISAFNEIFKCIFTNCSCSGLMTYIIMFIFGVIGTLIGWGVFNDGTDKLFKLFKK